MKLKIPMVPLNIQAVQIKKKTYFNSVI